MEYYKTFKRSCKNWKEFSTARKTIQSTGLTYEQAREECERFNSNLTSAQKRKGTKMEFTLQITPERGEEND